MEYTLVKIISKDILYIEGLKDYIQIHLVTGAKAVLTRMSMKAIEIKLPINAFVRTPKSFQVAISRITIIKKDCVCVGAVEIPVSETFRENVNRIARNV